MLSVPEKPFYGERGAFMQANQLTEILYRKGLLSENDSYTMIKGDEAESVSLIMNHPLMVRSFSREQLEGFITRLYRIYEADSPILLLMENGSILRMSLKEFGSYEGKLPCAVVFDRRKAAVSAAQPYSLKKIKETVGTLLAPGGCPWDRAQDHQSLRTYFIREVYEVIDSIDKEDRENLKEELGDVLFQVVFHASLAEKEGWFTMDDVVREISDKMIRRHPGVFGKEKSDSENANKSSWEKRKMAEKNRKYLLSGVPKSLPSLLLACIIQEKVSSDGLGDCFLPGESFDKLTGFLHDRMKQETADKKEIIAGSLLFAIDRVFSKEGIDPELALHRCCIAFMDRFRAFEERLKKSGKNLQDLTPEEAEKFWIKFNET